MEPVAATETWRLFARHSVENYLHFETSNYRYIICMLKKQKLCSKKRGEALSSVQMKNDHLSAILS
jgi:hypothetical protein